MQHDEIVAYYYSGPQDNGNSEFCKKRVEQIIARDELERDIKANGATIEHPDGPHSRHNILPLSILDDAG